MHLCHDIYQLFIVVLFGNDNRSMFYSVLVSKSSYEDTCLIYILDVNDIYCMSWYMYNYHRLQLICAKDANIGHSVTYYIKMMYSMRDRYTLKIIKTSCVMLKIDM